MTHLQHAIVESGRLIEASGESSDVPWWSFGKAVLAAAALALVDQGRLSLDGPLEGQAYSLRQLLQHRAGLRDYGELPAYHEAVARGDAPWTRSELLARMAVLPAWAPGEVWSYSNVGYMRLNELIAAASGMPAARALEELVLAPLAVTGVRLAKAGDAAVPGYDPGWVYHGLVAGPLPEAARLLDGLLGGRLLSSASLGEMRRGFSLPQAVSPVFKSPAYGLGLMISDDPELRLEGHSGGGPGSSVAIYRDEARGRTVAAFSRGEDPNVAERATIDLLRR
jgi:CubicO group peptidase (beta-lactamase class C family)